jgi:hypothetical protein
MKNVQNENNVDDELFEVRNSEVAAKHLSNTEKKDDGLLRPKLEDGKDGKRELIIRFLPNISKEGKLGPSAIEKHIHYANFKENPELQGYFDCLKNANIGKDCPLCKTYWALHNSKNPVDQDKAKLINRSTKYYTYVLVVEDTQVPDNTGKIFIFPYGFKIWQKIKAMKEKKKNPCTVEDLYYGADFNLIIEEVGGFYNYDQSMFDSPSPIVINGEEIQLGKDGKIVPADKQRIVEFLKSRTHELEDFMPKMWTDEQYEKADKIIAHLTGVYSETSSTRDVKLDRTEKPQPLTSSSVFDEEEEEDEEEKEVIVQKTAKPKAEKKPVEPVVEATDTSVAKAKSKASQFFEDDED